MYKYLKNNIKMYVESFKNLNILLVLLLNASFFLLTIGAGKLIGFFSEGWMEKLNNLDLESVALQSEVQLRGIVSTLRGFYLFVVFAIILFILFLILNWSFFQGMIWNILLKKKLNFRYFWKFSLLNVIWFLCWVIIAAAILFGGRTEYFIISFFVLMFLFLHFSFILCVLFTKENKFGQIKKALKLGVLRIHYFILPYIVILITFLIISQLNLLKVGYIFMGLIYLVFFSWMQKYIADVILDVNKARN